MGHRFTPNQFDAPPTTNDYPFVRPDVTPEQIKASLTTDQRGLLHAELHGMPTRDEKTGQPRMVDQDGVPIEPDDKDSPRFFEFVPYQPAVVGGMPRMVGVQNLRIPATAGRQRASARQGLSRSRRRPGQVPLPARDCGREEERIQTSWPLRLGVGCRRRCTTKATKVQTDWLHDFLMDPTQIRPAVVLRMPNFHMSSDEASKLVDYFAAKSNAEFPYEYNVRRRRGYMADLEQTHPALLNDAMKIVTNGNYCVKCHSLGDYQVKGAPKGLGPNLDQVYRRLRPDYVRRWVGNPQRILPYTGMPVNIPFDPTAAEFRWGEPRICSRGQAFRNWTAWWIC